VATFPSELQDAAEDLTPFATVARCPGTSLVMNVRIHSEAIAAAEAVFAWATETIDAVAGHEAPAEAEGGPINGRPA